MKDAQEVRIEVERLKARIAVEANKTAMTVLNAQIEALEWVLEVTP